MISAFVWTFVFLAILPFVGKCDTRLRWGWLLVLCLFAAWVLTGG